MWLIPKSAALALFLPALLAVEESSHQQHDGFTSHLHGLLLQNYPKASFFLLLFGSRVSSLHLTVSLLHFSVASCTLNQQGLLLSLVPRYVFSCC